MSSSPRTKPQDNRSSGLWERRRQSRKPALWVGKLETPAGTQECRVLNLSQSGAALELEAPVDIHEPATLTLDLLGEFVGSVKWRSGGCIGIAINERRYNTTRSRTFLPGEMRFP